MRTQFGIKLNLILMFKKIIYNIQHDLNNAKYTYSMDYTTHPLHMDTCNIYDVKQAKNPTTNIQLYMRAYAWLLLTFS